VTGKFRWQKKDLKGRGRKNGESGIGSRGKCVNASPSGKEDGMHTSDLRGQERHNLGHERKGNQKTGKVCRFRRLSSKQKK